MRTNINLAKQLAKEPVKLYGHVFTKGDPVIYHHRQSRNGICEITEQKGVYLSHKSFSTWHNGIEYRNNHHIITIINVAGEVDTTSWIKPINK